MDRSAQARIKEAVAGNLVRFPPRGDVIKLGGGGGSRSRNYARRTVRDFARLRRLYGHDAPAARWEECPEWCVQKV